VKNHRAHLDGLAQQFHVNLAACTTPPGPAVLPTALEAVSLPQEAEDLTHALLRYLAPGSRLRPGPRAGGWLTCSVGTRSMALNRLQSAAIALAKKVQQWSSHCCPDLRGPPRNARRPTNLDGCGPPLDTIPPANARCSSWRTTEGPASRPTPASCSATSAPFKTHARQGLIRLAHPD